MIDRRSYQQGSFCTPVAQPPAGSSLLFGALADSGRIKQRKNGSYRMVLKGVEEIDWFTDRPDRVAGEWSPKKLVKEWDLLFSDGDGAPNAQMAYTWTTFMDFVGAMKGRSNMSFEMFKPSVNKKGTKLSFEIKGIGKKNKELVAAQADRDVEDISLFIDDGTTGDRVVNLKIVAIGPSDKEFQIKLDSGFPEAVFGKPTMASGYTDAEFDNGSIYFFAGEEGEPGTLEVPVTLKNGLTSSGIIFTNQGVFGQIGQFCPVGSGAMVSYSVEGGSSGEVNVMCPEDFEPGMPGGGVGVDINWG